MKILYDDKHISVCIKDPMLLSEKSSSGNDILSKLDAYYKESGQSAKAYPLHRLDFGVGGVMVFAKSPQSAAKISAEIQQGRLEKHYLAIVSGAPEENEGVYNDLLFKDSKKNKVFVVDRKRAGVREAKLEYKVVDTKDIDKTKLSLVKIRLYTGRSHQIRVQFASRHTPLYGDRKYGAKQGNNIALWSHKLKFTHPATKEELEFESFPKTGIWDMFLDK